LRRAARWARIAATAGATTALLGLIAAAGPATPAAPVGPPAPAGPSVSAAPASGGPATPAAAGLTATFTLTSSWAHGYVARYTITNHARTAAEGWSISFGLPAGQRVGRYWGAREVASGGYYRFVNPGSGPVPAGGTAGFGFVVSGSFAPPTRCTVNGRPCGGGGPPAAAARPPSAPPPSAPPPSAPPAAGDAGDRFAVAPYVNLAGRRAGMLDAAARAGLRAFTAAFVTGSGCTPVWGDGRPVTSDPEISGEITRAEAAGAAPIVSFGGTAGTELASSCPDLGRLVAAYQSVISTLRVTHADFDIEGAAMADAASVRRRFVAISELEAADPGLVVSVTIPVRPTGPSRRGQAFLRLARANGARIDMVNILAMDYGAGFDQDADLGREAVQAARGTLSFLRTVTPAATFAMIGVTPMIGRNDDPAEVFSEADARILVSFARQSHLGRLAFWSVDRDQPCAGAVSGLSQCSQTSQQPLDFTAIFDGYAG
jgi:hypothetical protein